MLQELCKPASISICTAQISLSHQIGKCQVYYVAAANTFNVTANRKYGPRLAIQAYPQPPICTLAAAADVVTTGLTLGGSRGSSSTL